MKIVKLMDHAYPVYLNLDHIVSVRVESSFYVVDAVNWDSSRSFLIDKNKYFVEVLDALSNIQLEKHNHLIENIKR